MMFPFQTLSTRFKNDDRRQQFRESMISNTFNLLQCYMTEIDNPSDSATLRAPLILTAPSVVTTTPIRRRTGEPLIRFKSFPGLAPYLVGVGGMEKEGKMMSPVKKAIRGGRDMKI